MKRVGIFSGKVYSQEDYDNDLIKECAVCVSPSASDQDEALAETIEYASCQRLRNCFTCFGCEAAKLTIGRDAINV